MLTYILSILAGLAVGALINLYIGKMPREKPLFKLQPPLIMALTAGMAFASFYAFSSSYVSATLVFIFCSILIAVTFIDLEFKIIPDKITLPGIIIGLALGVTSEFFYRLPLPFTQGIMQWNYNSILGLLLGVGLPLLFVYLYYLLTKKVGFGMGDIKLLGLLGAWFGCEVILPVFFFSSVLGSICGITYILATKKDRRTEIPFGPYLAIGAILYIFLYIFSATNP